jgi:hypothetical protein
MSSTWDDLDKGRQSALIASGDVARYSIIEHTEGLFSLYRNTRDIMTLCSSSSPGNWNKRPVCSFTDKESAIKKGKELIEEDYQAYLRTQQEEWLN